MINGERWRSTLLCQVQYLKMKKDFKKSYDVHMKELRKKYPNLTFIGADGSPRGERDRSSRISIPEALKELQTIVAALQRSYPEKRFTLDGRLVGDMGEILVAEHYDLELLPGIAKHYDATTSHGRRVQIKTTMKGSLTFPCDHTPDYYIGIKINEDGSIIEVFNGPGAIAGKLLRNRKVTKTNLYSISINTLLRLNESISEPDRIPRRSK